MTYKAICKTICDILVIIDKMSHISSHDSICDGLTTTEIIKSRNSICDSIKQLW